MPEPETASEIVARKVAEVPLLPDHPRWTAASPLRVDLLGQTMILPMAGGTTQGVDVRALHDGTRFGVRLSWTNASEDRFVGIRSHRDACAVMFPASVGADLPPFFMGGPGTPVIIWQWKPDWEAPQGQQAARLQRYPEYGDYYNKANEASSEKFGDRPHRGEAANVVVAEGFGSATRTEDPDLECRSAFLGGEWQVVFRHPIPATYPPLSVGGKAALNLAVWDGAAGEVGPRKSLSYAWHTFELEGSPDEKRLPLPSLPTPGVVAAGATAAGIAWAIRRRMQNARSEEPPPGRRKR